MCLTTALEGEVPGGAGDSGAEAGGGAPSRAARALYRQLRARNPAPYAALLSLRGGAPEVCCSSPERFLKVRRPRCPALAMPRVRVRVKSAPLCLPAPQLCRGGWVEARPIKGTAPRDPSDPDRDALSASTLRDSEKDRAENLMIVDLLRNDLGRVCRVGTVHVPGIMEIQSFATVHQMASVGMERGTGGSIPRCFGNLRWRQASLCSPPCGCSATSQPFPLSPPHPLSSPFSLRARPSPPPPPRR